MKGATGPRLRLAVVGGGAITTLYHLPAAALCDAVETTVLVETDAARGKALAARFGVPEVTADWRTLPGRVDAAVVALPNHLHAPVSCGLLRSGVHVLVEKPMAHSVRECEEMIAAAGEGKTVLAVGHQFRFFDWSRLVGDLLREGVLGEVRHFELRQGVIPRWPFATDFLLKKETAGGGVLADFGVHVLDLLLWWLGDWTEAEYRDDAAGGVESDCELRLTLRSGLAGTVEISRTRNLRNTCIFTGSRATLEVGIWEPDPEIRLSTGTGEVDLAGQARRPGVGGLDFAGAFVRQIADFAAAIRAGREPFVPGREGRRSIALIEACYARRQPLVLPWSIAPAGQESKA